MHGKLPIRKNMAQQPTAAAAAAAAAAAMLLLLCLNDVLVIPEASASNSAVVVPLPPMPYTLVLLRHGESQWNAEVLALLRHSFRPSIYPEYMF